MALSACFKVTIVIAAILGLQNASANVVDDLPDLSVEGYSLLGSSPSTNWTVTFVQKQGYPIETHHVTTKDGYILTLHRIPSNREGSNKGGSPLLLHHGFMGCSADWVVLGPEKALGFILADKGYDVWMANARGSTYSRNHSSLSTFTRAFWNYSFHEIGVNDIPAEIDYILENTGKPSLSFVGFSMGTTAFFALGTTQPNYLKKVNQMFALGPVAYMQYVKGPALRWVAPLTSKVTTMITLFGGTGEFMPTNRFMTFAAKMFCRKDQISQMLCSNALFALFGFNADTVNSTLVQEIFQFSPAGGSIKTLIHFGQLVNKAPIFTQYNYGSEKNMIAYGQKDPPTYDFSVLDLPVHVFMADNDWFANKLDVQRLVSKLPRPKTVKLVERPNFNHFDFVYAADAHKLVYKDILKALEAEESKQA